MADIRKINSLDELDEFIKASSGEKISVLKIGSSWCGPCRMLESTLTGLTQEEVEGVLLAEVNADDEWFEDKAVEMRIRGIPVVLAYKDGEEKERVQGVMPKDKLLEFFARNK